METVELHRVYPDYAVGDDTFCEAIFRNNVLVDILCAIDVEQRNEIKMLVRML